MDEVSPDHIVSHATSDIDFIKRVFTIIEDENSVSKLVDLEQNQLQKTWLYYKKTFSLKKKEARPIA